MFGDYRADPKFGLEVALGSGLGIETGYTKLKSRGVHHVGMGRADERANALGTRGASAYLAGKLTVPIDDRLSAYGKLGVAASERKRHDLMAASVRASEVGVHAGVGARSKLSERASVTGQAERFGDSARKFGADTNANAVSARLKLGF